MELGVIPFAKFRPFSGARFEKAGKAIESDAVETILTTTRGHPYATQELCYFAWQRAAVDRPATPDDILGALSDVLRSEDSHFSVVWNALSAQQRALLQSLAVEEGRPLTSEYRRRHGLPPTSSVQRALQTLERAELVARDGGRAWISEPFLTEWLRVKAL